jgi:MoaA/NifB/PqqE/SkfB family radical SAM enzyme
MLTEETKLYFFWLLSKSWNNRTDMYSSLTVIKCPAAREKIGLQPYGDVVSCPLIQISYGNIREKSLREIQSEMLKNPFYNNNVQNCLPAMSEPFIREYLVDKK